MTESNRQTDATTPPQSESSAAGRRRFASGLFTVAWLVNAALLVGLCLWTFNDATIDPTGPWSYVDRATPRRAAGSSFESANRRILALNSLRFAAAATFGLMACGLYLGKAKHRRLLSWLGLTALAAGWLAALTSTSRIAWAGQRWQASRHIGAFEPLAASLRDDWPGADGTRPALGPFSAYPIANPRVLMPLMPPKHLAEGAVRLLCVERSRSGALRFSLLVNGASAWLEWHPGGSQPTSFAGGLGVRYELLESTPLRDGWSLARYREAAGDVTPQ